MRNISKLTRGPLGKAVLAVILAGGFTACTDSDNKSANVVPQNAQTPEGNEMERRDTAVSKSEERGAEPTADQGSSAGLVWNEIRIINEEELKGVDWTEEYIFDKYDENDDARLNKDEYVVFLSALSEESNAQANPPPESTLDTTAGVQARENELPSTVDAREEQMRIYGPDETASTEAVAIEDLDEASIKDREVVNHNQETIGEVEDVIVAPDGSILGLVVSVGGIMDVGDKNVLVPADEVKAYGDRIVWETFDEDQLSEMPEYRAG